MATSAFHSGGRGGGGAGAEKRCMLMENNRLINTGETAGAIGCMFAFNRRPEKVSP